MSAPVEKRSQIENGLEGEVARLVVETLKLEVRPAEVDPCAPLFGEGLGLDSIDMLEIALSVSKKYGFELRSEDRAAFKSLRSLTSHINQRRTR